MAPEIANLKDKSILYNEKCDIFSFGVIMHMVMLGKILFKGSNFNEVLQMNKKCSIKYNNPVYNTMDSHAKYIMFKCFSIDPEQRPSAASILESPFFNRNHI